MKLLLTQEELIEGLQDIESSISDETFEFLYSLIFVENFKNRELKDTVRRLHNPTEKDQRLIMDLEKHKDLYNEAVNHYNYNYLLRELSRLPKDKVELLTRENKIPGLELYLKGQNGKDTNPIVSYQYFIIPGDGKTTGTELHPGSITLSRTIIMSEEERNALIRGKIDYLKILCDNTKNAADSWTEKDESLSLSVEKFEELVTAIENNLCSKEEIPGLISCFTNSLKESLEGCSGLYIDLCASLLEEIEQSSNLPIAERMDLLKQNISFLAIINSFHKNANQNNTLRENRLFHKLVNKLYDLEHSDSSDEEKQRIIKILKAILNVYQRTGLYYNPLCKDLINEIDELERIKTSGLTAEERELIDTAEAYSEEILSVFGLNADDATKTLDLPQESDAVIGQGDAPRIRILTKKI